MHINLLHAFNRLLDIQRCVVVSRPTLPGNAMRCGAMQIAVPAAPELPSEATKLLHTSIARDRA